MSAAASSASPPVTGALDAVVKREFGASDDDHAENRENSTPNQNASGAAHQQPDSQSCTSASSPPATVTRLGAKKGEYCKLQYSFRSIERQRSAT